MSIPINSRKKRFLKDLTNHFAMLPAGSWRYRKKARITLQSITEDLAYLDALPMRLKNLEASAIIQLVNYWQASHIGPKTIRNKLGVLRGLISKLDQAVIIPTNQQLNIIVKNKKFRIDKNQEFINPYTLPLYPVFLVKEVCIFQSLFGLKLHEAIKIDSSMVHDTHLEIHHSISFNKKDRRVRVESPEQKEFISKFRISLKGFLPISQDQYPCFINLYHYLHKQLKISHEDYFRHLYIIRRYQELLPQHDKFESLEVIREEVGYSKIGQIRGIVACQEDF